MRLRVAPYPASFGRAGDESTSCPVHSVHSAVPAMDHRVASTFASSTLPVLKLRVAPILRCLVSPIDEVPGYPVFHLPALPAMDLRVASNFASFGGADWSLPQVAPVPRSFGIADDESSGCPEFPSSGSGWWISKFPRIAPSGLPVAILKVAPKFRLWLLRRFESPGRPESPFPRRSPTDQSSKLPQSFDPSADPYMLPRVAPIPHLRLGR